MKFFDPGIGKLPAAIIRARYDPAFRQAIMGSPPNPVRAKLQIKEGALGSRKSEAQLKRIAKSGKRSLILVPELDNLARQTQVRLQGFMGERRAVEEGVVIYRGRMNKRKLPDGSKEYTCRKGELSERLSDHGHDPSWLCQQSDKYGNIISRCEHADSCAIYAGMFDKALEARIVIAAHATLPYFLKNHGAFDEIVIDECPLGTLVQEDIFRADVLIRALGDDPLGMVGSKIRDADPVNVVAAAKKVGEAIVEAGRQSGGLRTVWLNLKDLPSYVLLEALAKVLKRQGAGRRPSWAMPNNDETIFQQLAGQPKFISEHRNFAIDFLDRLMKAMQMADLNGRLPGIEPTKAIIRDGKLHRTSMTAQGDDVFDAVSIATLKLPGDAHALPTTLLTSTPVRDHDGQFRAYKRLYKDVESDSALWEHGGGSEYTIISNSGSKAKMVTAGPEEEAGVATTQLQKITSFVSDQASEWHRDGRFSAPHACFFSTTAIVEAAKPHMPKQVHAQHFAVIRGMDNVKCLPLYMIVGHASPFPSQLRLQGEAIARRVVELQHNQEWWKRERIPIDTDDGQAIVVRTYHDHWGLESIRQMVMDSQTIQADRSRDLIPLGHELRGGRPISQVYYVGWKAGVPPFRIKRVVTIDQLIDHWHPTLHQRGIVPDPTAFQCRNELLSWLLYGNGDDADKVKERLFYLKKKAGETFEQRAARTGFRFNRPGWLYMPGKRRVAVNIDSADWEGAVAAVDRLIAEGWLPPGSVCKQRKPRGTMQ